jgi:CheY-like chemotaxis protein
MSSAGQTLRILVVEDHDDTRHMMVRLLSRNHNVIEADSYDAALLRAAESPLDLVISDISLHDRSGVELMRELSAQHGVPGIAITGHPIEDPKELTSAGFTTYFLKPICFDQLVRAISQVAAQLAA